MARYEFLTLNSAAIATEARNHAIENGQPVGSIGRVSVDVIADYLVAQPKTARELADFLGVPVSSKGRLKKDAAKELAAAIR